MNYIYIEGELHKTQGKNPLHIEESYTYTEPGNTYGENLHIDGTTKRMGKNYYALIGLLYYITEEKLQDIGNSGVKSAAGMHPLAGPGGSGERFPR